jgi:broad specificity phosphatase PhoE
LKLYLIRHGEEYRADTEVHGHMDVPLSLHGMEQSKDLVAKLMTEGIKRIYSSDLTRAVQTAMPFSRASGLGLIPDERLRPIKLGEYEGRNFNDVKAELKHWEDAWLTDEKATIPGGDSFDSFQSRNLSFFRELAESLPNDEPVAVFTHSRNCHLMQHWAANDMRPLKHGTEDILHPCDHELGTYRTYQIDKTSNLTRLTNAGQKGKSYSMRFIEPGLVRYEDVGDVLVQKPALDSMMQSFVGCPVFDRTHKDTTDKDFTSGKADGIITRVWQGDDGWHWCEALVWDPDTQQHMRDGYGLSCAYDVLQWTNSEGTWHNIPYANEVARGKYTHLAIVKKPRYEEVRIIANQGGSMKLKFWEKDKKTEDAPSEVELTNAKVDVDGNEVELNTVIESFRAEEKRKADELANATKKLALEDVIDIDGKKVPLKDIIVAHKVRLANDVENAMSKDHEDGKHKGKKMEGCGKCSNELENEKKVALEAEAAAKAKTDADAKAEADRKAEELRNAKNKGQQPKMPDLPPDRSDRLRLGSEQYGPVASSN